LAIVHPRSQQFDSKLFIRFQPSTLYTLRSICEAPRQQSISTFRLMRRTRASGTLTLPQNGAHKVRVSWQERFAESPDVLIGADCHQTVVPVLDFAIGGDELTIMAGPCSVESEAQLMATAYRVRQAGARVLRGGAFKPRSSPYAFQGLGLEALKLLASARKETGLAIITEVMSENDVPLVAEYADILQIGSRSMENYTLLEAAARSGRPILLKRGMVATIADMLASAQVILSNGNPNVMLCERGIRTFETALRNTFDSAGIALLKLISHLPVIADPSHAAGHRDLVSALARIGIAAGADGLLVEVHPNPDKALSDGDQSLDFAEFEGMMDELEPWIKLRRTLPHLNQLHQHNRAEICPMEAVG
jgi:3-deoxy-7-phosphoheptulonate synthase